VLRPSDSVAGMNRPVWQRTWYVLTAIFAISLLVTALQWNTSPPTPRPVAARPVPANVQFGQQCLDSGKVCVLS
jgi:hypothetical protein